TALVSDDRVALYTFDTKPALRYRGMVGSNPASILDMLPAAVGNGTDIGLAIEAGVKEFERSDARDSGAILLFTDGKVDTEPDARFATVGNSDWRALRARAAKIQDRNQVAPLAISLTSSSDAVLLKQVFEGVTTVPGDNLGTYLANVSSNVERAGVRAAIASDLKAGVRLKLDAVSRPGGKSTLTITSNTKRLPLTLSGVKLTEGATVKDAPASIDVAPGKSVTVPVTLAFPASATGDLTITAMVESSWQKVATSELGLKWNPTLAGILTVPNGTEAPSTPTPSASASATTTPGPGLTFAPWMAYAAGGVGLLALGALGARAVAARRPHLVGSILVTRNGEVVAKQMLHGLKMKLSEADLHATLTPLVEKKRAVTGVQVSFSGSAKASSRVLRDGESLTVGDTTISWTSQRSRMLDLIQSGVEPPKKDRGGTQ
ncbi:MAG TPA: hypothetical protein VLR88_06675, partial [Propionibacteriaceae bacterium]|nr:hypothetical protein [Propionibacteriaceae bacterium]